MANEWFGESRFHPYVNGDNVNGDKKSKLLKPHIKFPTPTLSVEQLIQVLSELNPKTPVGICMTSIHGFVNGIESVSKDVYGCIILNMTEEQLYDDEVDIK